MEAGRQVIGDLLRVECHPGVDLNFLLLRASDDHLARIFQLLATFDLNNLLVLEHARAVSWTYTETILA